MKKKKSPRISIISPILIIDGLLTITAFFVLFSSVPTNLPRIQQVASLLWLGFAGVHLLGWLATVIRLRVLRTLLERHNLLRVFDIHIFLWIYAVLTTALLILLRAS